MTDEIYETRSSDTAGSPRATCDSKPKRPLHKRRPRKPVNCGPCRLSKLKCDRQHPCASCRRRGCIEACTYRRDQVNFPAGLGLNAQTTSSIASPVQQQTPPSNPREQDLSSLLSDLTQSNSDLAQDHRNDTHGQWDALLQRPMDKAGHSAASPNGPFSPPGTLCFPFSLGPTVSRNEILAILPPPHCCDYLVTEYFARLSPLFHILHGPTFQKQYNTFRQNSSQADISWLALLFAICSATMNTMESDDATLAELWLDTSRPLDTSNIAYRFRTAAMVCLSQDQFMIRHSLSTLETLLLLIYTISNHEGAERSWTLLGKTWHLGTTLGFSGF